MASGDQLQPNNIPRDIIFDILLKLRIKSLCRFKSASKDWLALINNVLEVHDSDESRKLIVPSISEENPTSFYTLDPSSPNEFVEIKSFQNHSLHIVGSCNGLLLLCSCCYIPQLIYVIYLWNPLTGKLREIHLPDDSRRKVLVIAGLSYDSGTDEFKLVMAIEGYKSYSFDFNNPAYIFTTTSSSVSSSSSWNRVGFFRYCEASDRQVVVLNGSPHWIVTRQRFADSIVYFDPHKEAFIELPVPDHMDSNLSSCRLTVLVKNLCYVNYSGYSSADNIQIWMLKESSWSKLCVMPHWPEGIYAHLFMPLCTSVVGEEDELINGGDQARALALCNLKDKISEWRLKLPRDCYMNHMVCYVETLASPYKIL